MQELTSKLKEILKGKVVIVGIGNKLRSDDGFGPIMIERLHGKINAIFFNTGTAPESFLGPIIKSRPDTLVILDVADMRAPAGSIDILDKNDILKTGFTTHDASPKMFIEFLEENIKAKIYMIAVQPKTTQFGEGLSSEVMKSVKKLENILTRDIKL